MRWLLALALLPGLLSAPTSAATVEQLVEGLEELALALEGEPSLEGEFLDLVESHGLLGSPDQYRDFVRLRTVFEATRDGGLWGLRWTITDREPSSENIWRQWAAWTPPEGDDPLGTPTADAECDELSALCAWLARRLGVNGVGLFWPQSNHTVAVWSTEGVGETAVRVVIPTSQIFLGPDETLGTRQFDPWSQRTIYTYGGSDVADAFALPGELVRRFLGVIEENGARSRGDLQSRRNLRAREVGGS